jgi:hypothetical protein
MLAAINRDTEKQRDPIPFEDVVSWLGHGFQRVPAPVPPAPPSVEDLKDKIGMVHLLHKTLYGDNGATDGDAA